MPSFRDIILGNPQLGLPRGLVPRLQAAAHQWQRRGGAPAADVGSLPLGRAPTRAEIAASSNVQQEEDAAARPNIMELLTGKLGPSRTLFLGARALHAPVDRMGRAMKAMQEGQAPRDVYRSTGITKGAEGAPRFEISDASARLRKGQEFDDLYEGEAIYGSAEEMLKHPELLANYPDLGNLNLVIRKGPLGGALNVASQTIDVSGMNRKEVLSALLHEFQHGVQQIENHAKGGSRSLMRPLAQEAMTKAARRLYRLREALKSRGKDQDMLALFDTKTYKQLEKQLEAGENPAEIRRLYERLAGEVEARNTQVRQGMSAAERAGSFPEDTEDVERMLQIIRRSPRL